MEIPAHYVTEDGKKLGVWLNNQKSCYKRKYQDTGGNQSRLGEPGLSLTKEQAKRLEGLGVCWPSETRGTGQPGMVQGKESPWEYRCKLAEAYYKEHDNLDISQQYVSEEGVWLGKWLYIQKVQYKKGVLDSWKKERLEKAGVNFLSSSESAFERGCRALEEYSRAVCAGKITKTAVMSDGYRLGEWVYRQKRKKRAGKLTKEQVKRLGALGVE